MIRKTALEYYNLPVTERKRKLLLLCNKKEFSPPDNLAPELHQTYRLSKALDTFLVSYFKIDLKKFSPAFSLAENRAKMIRTEIDQFINDAIRKMRTERENFIVNATVNPKNLYELGGALKLAFGNNATRTISTSLGLLWEKIACISPYALNPEAEFGVKLNGIDAIILDPEIEKLIYSQIKTQKNTLTGSQRSRSVAELTLHENRQFIACFLTSASWTFKSDLVPRICGKEFWESIGFTYQEIIAELNRMMPLLDEGYIDLIE